jgi:hypothetical protein
MTNLLMLLVSLLLSVQTLASTAANEEESPFLIVRKMLSCLSHRLGVSLLITLTHTHSLSLSLFIHRFSTAVPRAVVCTFLNLCSKSV